MIYLDHNATTPLAPRVFEAMMPYMTVHWGNPSSPYRFGSDAKMAVENARGRIAEYLGCKPAEILFTGGGTESDTLAVCGVAHAFRYRGNHIVTAAIEHPAVLNACRALESEGYQVTYLPVGADGVVEMDKLAKSLTPETILVTVMHANHETGIIQPIGEIAAIVKKHGIAFHTDAVQTLGKMPCRPGKLGADLVSFSGHKFYGPKGIAALYVREGIPVSLLLSGGPYDRALRGGTENVAGIVGLAEAMALALDSLEGESNRLRDLRDQFERRVCAAVQKARINGLASPRLPNTSSVSFDGVDGESIVSGLDLEDICVSTGSACSAGDPKPSRVLLAMGLPMSQARGTIRISLGKNTREADIDVTVDALMLTVQRLRSASSIKVKAQLDTSFISEWASVSR